MSFERFLDTRFGDPILTLTCNSNGFAYGTMMGTVLFQKFTPSQCEPTIVYEVNDEPIYSLSLSDNNTLYGAIGDQKYFTASNLGQQHQLEDKFFNHEHDSSNCYRTQALLHHETICLITAHDKTQFADLSGQNQNQNYWAGVIKWNILDIDQINKMKLNLHPTTVPMDFDGRELLQYFIVDIWNLTNSKEKDHYESQMLPKLSNKNLEKQKSFHIKKNMFRSAKFGKKQQYMSMVIVKFIKLIKIVETQQET